MRPHLVAKVKREQEKANRETEKLQLSKAFIKEAKEADKEIRDRWDSIETSRLEVGRLCRQFSAEKYHLALGFPNFGEWAANVFGKSAATIFAQMRVSKLLTENGPGKIPDADLRDINPSNAMSLAKLPPKVRTLRRIVEAAKVLTNKDFEVQHVIPALKKEGITDADEPKVRVGPWLVRTSIADMVKQGNDIAMRLNRDVAAEDQEHDMSAIEKALRSIYASFIAENEGEYDELMKSDAAADAAAVNEKHGPGSKEHREEIAAHGR